jgi:rhamnose utilization protein RhaD (predicted bifunctional aldolase and dehydrogenase)/NAD(P)-dependent dehydrogenase (short-subunit alcohol dehydrogenase family)
MKSLWTDEEAAAWRGDLGLRVYTSRLLGRDKSLVLHGGGNTSVKVREPDLFGAEEEILHVKGSGWDLEKIEEAGFAPVRRGHLVRLAGLDELSDPHMVNEMVTHMKRSSAPTPSVEAILHAILPHKFVDHTHADAVVAVTNTPGGEERIRRIYGDSVVVIPYIMPGFDLARLCARLYPEQAGPQTIGMVLINHGIFSFGETARESYERMIQLVTLAEEYLEAEAPHSSSSHQRAPSPIPSRPPGEGGRVAGGSARSSLDGLENVPPLPRDGRGWERGPAGERTMGEGPSPAAIATLRRDVSRAAGAPMILLSRRDARSLAFARREDVATISQQGPATPDHVIRTKHVPLLGRDVAAYVRAYGEYFATHAPHARSPKTMLDPAPRVILDPELGLLTAGRRATDAAIAAEIYEHTMDIIERAERLGGWRALPERDLFDMEYWDLEQAKLKKSGNPPVFAGEVALVTGAASGIGRASVDALLARGAAVVGLDRDPAILALSGLSGRADFRGIVCDVTDETAVRRALAETVDAFGGLDMLVLNAGIFPPGRPLGELAMEEWRRVFAVNLDANLSFLRESHPLLALAPNGGRVVVIGSKNVPAPGPGAAAYSASKAALSQLARVAALEWGRDDIRINVLHPNAVFDTGVWTDEVLAARASAYGLDVESYKKNNVLRVEVTSRHVAELAAELCGPLFARTTGAQIPVDGGNERVI